MVFQTAWSGGDRRRRRQDHVLHGVGERQSLALLGVQRPVLGGEGGGPLVDLGPVIEMGDVGVVGGDDCVRRYSLSTALMAGPEGSRAQMRVRLPGKRRQPPVQARHERGRDDHGGGEVAAQIGRERDHREHRPHGQYATIGIE